MLKSIRVVSTNTILKNERLGLYYTDTSPFQVVSVEGLDPVPATINTTDSVYKAGSYYNSTKVQNRNIVFTIDLNPTNLFPTVEICRNRLYELFITGGHVLLEFVTDYLDKPVRIMGWVETFDTGLFSDKPVATISLICPDPYFYEAELTTVSTPSNSGDFRAHAGTAPSPIIVKKTFDKTSGFFDIQNNYDGKIGFNGIPQGATLEVSFDPRDRYVKLEKGNDVLNGYTYITRGALELTVSRSRAHIGFFGTMNATPGFEISFRKAYLGL